VVEHAIPQAKKNLAIKDYQRELLKRTQSAQQFDSVSNRYISFWAGGCGWLIRVLDAAEIMPMPLVAPVPGTYDWFRGLVNYRGKLISVIDFDCLLTGKLHSYSRNDRLIVLSNHYPIPCALKVSELRGSFDINFQQKKSNQMSSHLWSDETHVIDSITWNELSISRMMADPLFLKAHPE
jgi:twitching motility protein PilI